MKNHKVYIGFKISSYVIHRSSKLQHFINFINVNKITMLCNILLKALATLDVNNMTT